MLCCVKQLIANKLIAYNRGNADIYNILRDLLLRVNDPPFGILW